MKNNVLRYKKDVLTVAHEYLKLKKKGEFTTKELMTHIIENKMISTAPLYLKLDDKGRRLGSILSRSNQFVYENKYSKEYSTVVKHWRKKEEKER